MKTQLENKIKSLTTEMLIETFKGLDAGIGGTRS